MAKKLTATHCLSELKTKERILSSIHKISSLLTRPISVDKILTCIVEETAKVFGFLRVGIFLTNKEKGLLECKYLIGFNREETERALTKPYRLADHDCLDTKVARLGKTIYSPDMVNDPRATSLDLKVSQNMKRLATIIAPLKIKRDTIGLIVADRRDQELHLTKKDIDSFSTFANQASIIIENARLQEQNQRKIRQLLALQEISRKTSSTINLNKLLNVISASALKITKASSCALLLVDDDGKHLRIASQIGYEELDDLENFRLQMGEGVAGWVAQHGVPLLVRYVSQELRYVEVMKEVESELAVPLISENKVLGVLNVDSRNRAAFSEDDLKLLMIYAGHTASLIKNARLYGQVMTERNFRENILESSPNSVIAVNMKKEITSINRRTEELFNLKRKNALGQKAADVFGPEIIQLIDLAIDEGELIDYKEIRKNRKDGSQLTLGIISSWLRDHQGNLIGMVFIVRDLTEGKRTEELIRRMDRLTSIGRLSAGIAHEIRNPLASISLNVQILSKKLALDDASKSIVSDTLEGIDRIKSLVKGMLDFAKPSTPALKRDSIARVLRNSISLLDSQLRKKRIEVKLDLAEDLPEVVLDEHQIQQVFVNLLLNGLEAMSDGGSIRIRSTIGKDHKKRRQLALHIMDTGCGIPPYNLSKIFDPFFTTKPEGTGLGLPIVHKILESHHASIHVVSEENRGTTFILSFPIHLAGGLDVSL
ncbi:MAG: GAF domain-containing protein [Deltaproteobacteria bacterium]|nr:GAF domain-containing protein [Deltaproteobacteria bacterium]